MPLTTGQWPLGYYSDVKGRQEYSWGPPRHSIVNGEYFPFCIHQNFRNPLQNEWATLVGTLIWWLGHIQVWKGDTLYRRDESWNRATLGHKKSVHHWYIDLPAVLPKCCKKESFFTYSIRPTMSLTIIEVCEKYISFVWRVSMIYLYTSIHKQFQGISPTTTLLALDSQVRIGFVAWVWFPYYHGQSKNSW